jgi:hypothetical protein
MLRRIFTHRAKNCIALQPLFLRRDLRASVRTFQRQSEREREILITQVLRRSASLFFIKVRRAGTKQTNKHIASKQPAIKVSLGRA